MSDPTENPGLILHITAAGRAQRMQARLTGLPLPRFSGFAVDTVDQADLSHPVMTTAYVSSSPNEVIIDPIDDVAFGIRLLIPATFGAWVRGLALLTENGEIYAYAKYASENGGMYKPVGVAIRQMLILAEDGRESVEFVYSVMDVGQLRDQLIDALAENGGGGLDESDVNTLISAALAENGGGGGLDESDVNTLISAALAENGGGGGLDESDVNTLISAALAENGGGGGLDESDVNTLINNALADFDGGPGNLITTPIITGATSALAGQSVTLAASGSAYLWGGNVGITYRWVKNGVTIADAATLSVAAGETVSVIARGDNNSTSGTVDRTIAVTANAPPNTPTAITDLPAVVQRGQSYSVQYTATDPEGDAVTISYENAIGCTITGNNVTINAAATAVSYDVIATDSHGSTSPFLSVTRSGANVVAPPNSTVLTPGSSYAGGIVDADGMGIVWDTPGTYTFAPPAGVTHIHGVAVATGNTHGGGSLSWLNNRAVSSPITITVSATASSIGTLTSAVSAGYNTFTGSHIRSSRSGGDGGGRGTLTTNRSLCINCCCIVIYSWGNGGAGGYAGDGGEGVEHQRNEDESESTQNWILIQNPATAGAGGAGGGGNHGGNGGGVGIYGQGANGVAGGGNGSPGANGKFYGAGGGGNDGGGAVRIMWGGNRSFPSAAGVQL